MKCEVCLDLLEEYLDAELPPQEQAQVGEHLIACSDCSESFAALTEEQELFARYDRELEVPPFLWTRVAAHTVSEKPRRGWASLVARPLARVIAVVLLAIAFGVVYLLSRQPTPKPAIAQENNPTLPRNGTDRAQQRDQKAAASQEDPQPKFVAAQSKPKLRIRPNTKITPADQSDVLSSDLAYLDIDDQDTAKHIEQSQNLLRSIRNVPTPDSDEEIDVSYDKALSRRLLNENVVLRRDAEMKAKFPTKTLLTDLEPFLIDIANLPDRAKPEEVRAIKERVQKTEIVAALIDYQDRGTNNR